MQAVRLNAWQRLPCNTAVHDGLVTLISAVPHPRQRAQVPVANGNYLIIAMYKYHITF